MKYYISLTLLLLVALTAQAGNNTAIQDDKDLSRVLMALKGADGYAYRISMATVDSANGKTVIGNPDVMNCYASQAAFIFYAAGSGMLQLTASFGSFRCMEAKKEVLYRSFTTDSMLKAAKAGYIVNAGALIDSVLLHGAYIRQKKVHNGVASYQLGYSNGGMVQEMEVTLNARKDFVASVRYKIARPLGPGQSVITQEITMDDYQHQPPPKLSAMLTAIQHSSLRGYLLQQYSGYKLRSF